VNGVSANQIKKGLTHFRVKPHTQHLIAAFGEVSQPLASAIREDWITLANSHLKAMIEFSEPVG
jgi:hypothetical protein